MIDLESPDFKWCIRCDCPYLKNSMKNPEYHYIGQYYCGLPLKKRFSKCPRWNKELLEKTGCKCILISVDTEYIENKRCCDCGYYETDYETVIAFGDYETLTKESCSLGHLIFDDTANECEDYYEKDDWNDSK